MPRMSSARVRSSSSSPRSIRIVSLRPPTSRTTAKTTEAAAHKAPSWGLPPIQKATKVGTATPATNAGTNHLGGRLFLVVCMKDLLDSASEESGERDRERQRR